MAFNNIKSVVIDIVDNWGLTNGVGVRSIEFTNGGVVIPLDYTDTVCYATSSHAAYPPSDAFNTTQLKTGAQDNGEWICTSYYQAVRLICVFNVAIDFNGMVINNIHHSGTNTNNGIKNIKIYTSTDTITSTVYDEAITNSALIFTGEIPIHISENIIDDYVLPFTTEGTINFSPAAGAIPPDTYVTLSGTNPLADIYYTIDGSDPSLESTFLDITGETYAIGLEGAAYMGGAFDDSTSDANATGAWYANNGAYINTGWTGQNFTSIGPQLVNVYKVYPMSGSERSYDPKDWTFEGSQNGTDWDVLDTQTTQSFTSSEWAVYSFTNTTSYNYYRFNVSLNNGGSYLVVQEMEMGYTGFMASKYTSPIQIGTSLTTIKAVLNTSGALSSVEFLAMYTYADPIFKYSGYVQADGIPTRIKVRLYRRDTGVLLTEGWSDAVGGYFELLSYIDTMCYAVFMPELEDTYNMIVSDRISVVFAGY